MASPGVRTVVWRLSRVPALVHGDQAWSVTQLVVRSDTFCPGVNTVVSCFLPPWSRHLLVFCQRLPLESILQNTFVDTFSQTGVFNLRYITFCVRAAVLVPVSMLLDIMRLFRYRVDLGSWPFSSVSRNL